MQVIVQISVTPAKVPQLAKARQPKDQKSYTAVVFSLQMSTRYATHNLGDFE